MEAKTFTTDDYTATNRAQWSFAQIWAARLSDRDLRAAKRLKVPGDAGLAVDQEHGRRFNPFTVS